jgi:hypothetical protein
MANNMSEIRLDDEQRENFFLRVVSNNQSPTNIRMMDKEDPDRKAIATKVNRLIHYHNVEGSGSDNVRNLSTANRTLWGALNDVTGVSDHWGTKRGKEGRFTSSIFGARRKQKDLAWEIATEVVTRKAA